MRATFHLSLPVPELERSLEFFTALLGGTVTHRDPAWVNIDLCGIQLTLSPGSSPASESGFHLGLNVPSSQFSLIAARLLSSPLAQVVSHPRTVDAGTPMGYFTSSNPHDPLFMKCDDPVENKGHQFGVSLSADDKLALREFLKIL